MKRILVLRLSALGDVIHTIPAVTAFRDADISWVVEAPYAELVEIVTGVQAIPVRMKKWGRSLISSRGEMRDTLEKMRGADVSIDFQGLVKSAMLGAFAGAKMRYGFDREAVREKASLLFTNEKVKVDTTKHVVEQNLELARHVRVLEEGSRIPLRPPHPPSAPFDSLRSLRAGSSSPLHGGEGRSNDEHPDRLPLSRSSVDEPRTIDGHPHRDPSPPRAGEKVPKADEGVHTAANWDAFPEPIDVRPGKTVILPGAGKANKLWPINRFRELAARLDDPLVVWGPGEAERAQAIGARIAPPTNLRELAWLLRNAELVIGGDTGPLHLAAALGTRVVGLYGPTNPRRNGPYGQLDHVVDESVTTKLMEAITVESVMKVVERVSAE